MGRVLELVGRLVMKVRPPDMGSVLHQDMCKIKPVGFAKGGMITEEQRILDIITRSFWKFNECDSLCSYDVAKSGTDKEDMARLMYEVYHSQAVNVVNALESNGYAIGSFR